MIQSRLIFFLLFALLGGPLFGLGLRAWLGDGAGAQDAAAALALVTSSFLRLVKMIIAPLVFSTLTVGVARMHGAAAIVRVGARTIGWFMLATAVSLLIGTVVVQIVAPGHGLSLVAPAVTATPAQVQTQALHLKDFLEHVIPSSIVDAMARNEILQIVVFALFFGTAAASQGPKAASLIEVIDQLAGVILKVTSYVMALAPVAVFAALAATVLEQGAAVLLVYLKFIGAFYFAILLLWCFFAAVLFLSIGRRAAGLLPCIRTPVLLAFSTASSEAAYPQTLRGLEDFGVSKRIASFVLPLGYSFNLDGSAMYCAFAMLFIAQIYHIELSWQRQVVMLLVLMVTSKGIAGVPRAALLVVASTLGYFGLPEQGLVFIVAVDHLMDMGRTATNVVGNAVASTLVAKWERELGSTT